MTNLCQYVDSTGKKCGLTESNLVHSYEAAAPDKPMHPFQPVPVEPAGGPRCTCTSEPANQEEDNFLPVYTRNPRCPLHAEAVASEPKGAKRPISFSLSPWVMEAIRECAAELGTKNLSAAVEHIVLSVAAKNRAEGASQPEPAATAFMSAEESDWRKLPIGAWFFHDSPTCTQRYSVQERTDGGCSIVCSTPYHHDRAKRDMQEVAELHNWAANAKLQHERQK